jgi:hypothetical protein
MSTSKYTQLSQKYPIIIPISGYEIYHDHDFEPNRKYMEFREDYNKLIHREIKSNNIVAVYTLCAWIYYCDEYDKETPHFDLMLEIALKEECVNIPMFVFVLYMWKYWPDNRDESITLDAAIHFASCQEKSNIIIEYFDYGTKDDLKNFIIALGVNVDELTKELKAVQKMVKHR